MRTPTWESSTGALAAFLNSATGGIWADLVTITLLGGQVLRYSAEDRPVTVNGNTFDRGPLVLLGSTRLQVGIEVDTHEMTLVADATVQVNGTPLLAFIRSGGLDGARVQIERGYGPDWATGIVGTLSRFSGRVGETAVTRYEAKLSVGSDLELLNVMVPRNVYQPGCLNTVFDSICGLDRAAYTVSSTAASASDVMRLYFTNTLAQAAGHFDLGVVRFTSGLNAGVSRTVRSYAPGGQIVTIAPWPFAVAAGDAFAAYPGCNKTMPTCSSKFGNLIRFRGQPFVPAPETVT
jgi:uncharacterized phage protein (TIGR02218 family)